MPTYVSCRYAPPPPPDLIGFDQMIICVDADGNEEWVPPNSTEGSWKAFIEAGGTVDPYEPPPPPEEPT